ncbi:hypothetical protein ACF1BB_02835 [Streptomyces griseoluteus]|uniref:hypothetical protein n=1 Tax=Streptomyces griseoluteus TaxID=29306 RepID=UPI0036F8BDFF
MPTSCRRLMVLGVLGAAVLCPVTACSADHSDGKQPVRAGQATASRSATPAAPRGGQPSVQEPPELNAGETLAGRQKVTTGNAEVGFASGGKGDALIIAVRCQGAGTVKVVVRPVRVSFPLKCLAGKAGTIYNQVAVSGANRDGTVSVEAPPAVRWSLTVGRGAPAEEEPPTG